MCEGYILARMETAWLEDTGHGRIMVTLFCHELECNTHLRAT